MTYSVVLHVHIMAILEVPMCVFFFFFSADFAAGAQERLNF